MHTTDFRFLPSSQNSQIFLAHYSPADNNLAAERKAVIFVPPFAEEMNRSRRMYVLCARLLAGIGIDCVCFDYAGTGDSEGKWGSFSIVDWQENLKDVYQSVCQTGISDISLIGVRFAALQIAHTLAAAELKINKCVLWDPIESGETYMRQLIRMKIAAAMAEESKKISTKDVLAEVEEQGSIEIGGYLLTDTMINTINELSLSGTIDKLIAATDLHWMTLSRVNREGAATTPACVPKDLVDKLSMHLIRDTKFWMQQEVTISPLLLRSTCNLFANA